MGVGVRLELGLGLGLRLGGRVRVRFTWEKVREPESSSPLITALEYAILLLPRWVRVRIRVKVKG